MTEDSRNKKVKLKDGRSLGFAEFGDPLGKPLFFFHGQPGCRLGGSIFNETAGRLGVRVICPDRPGYGLSDFQPGRSLLDWASDVEELADHLGLERFNVMGFSGGGPYSIVCAYALPERVKTALFVSGVGPANAPGVTEGMSLPNRMLIAMVSLFPSLATIPFRQMARNLENNPDKVYASLYASASPADQRLMDLPETRRHTIEDLREGLRPGVRGVAWEVVLYTRSWGFPLKDIRTQVILWQGEEDVNTPLKMGHYLANNIPNCQAHFIQGEGHHSLLFHHMESILNINEEV